VRTKAGWIAILGALSCLLAACGDDDDSNHAVDAAIDSGVPDAGEMPDAGRPVPTNAGKPCKRNADCGDGGLCATRTVWQPMEPEENAPNGYCTKICTTAAECGLGADCVADLRAFVGDDDMEGIGGGTAAGLCMDRCTRASECRDGYLCAAGLEFDEMRNADTCVPVPATDHPADGSVGKACKRDADCKGGRCLSKLWDYGSGPSLPGGYCSGRCMTDDQCGAGAACMYGTPGPLTGSCRQSCTDDADCTRDGYRCRYMGCEPGDDPLPDGRTGKACKSNSDCGAGIAECARDLPGDGGYSITRERFPAAGGYCTLQCLESSDCGAGGVCLTPMFGGTQVATLCYARCSSRDDCRDGYSCRVRDQNMTYSDDPEGGGQSPTVCTPDQPDDDAGIGM
jgi:hypothetical protein